MISVCLYFQVHQPYRLRRDYNFFQVGSADLSAEALAKTDSLGFPYEDEGLNYAMLRQVAEKCYLPANALLLDLIHRFSGRFRLSFSISGTALEQFENYAPEVLDSFRKLVATGCVELLAETYYHSLAFVFSREEFRDQVKAHRAKLKEIFDYQPRSFRNTELIYNNDLAQEIEQLGYAAILTEGANQILGWRTPNFVYQPAPPDVKQLKLLLKNYRLSDDLAFRFPKLRADSTPRLFAAEYAHRIHELAAQPPAHLSPVTSQPGAEVVNLFMDYETFGEHQWAETGIFEFLRELPAAILGDPGFGFKTPSEVAAACEPKARIDVPYFISWADAERDLTAWLGNPMQDSALEYLYSMREAVLATGDPALIHAWRKLQTSDHFYYMCTKWFSDGEIHKYFNPFINPHEAYVVYINVLNDIHETLRRRGLADLRTNETARRA